MLLLLFDQQFYVLYLPIVWVQDWKESIIFFVLVQISPRADYREKQLCSAFRSLMFVDTGHADIFLLVSVISSRQ